MIQTGCQVPSIHIRARYREMDIVLPAQFLMNTSASRSSTIWTLLPEQDVVAWHQDLTIAVRDKVEALGFGPWSVKDGVPHVQPPVSLLENMVTVRQHLDDADESNGALKVLPGSHNQGRLSGERIQQLRQELPEHLCVASAGDALLMRPLILHASGRSSTDRHRRVLHIEYAGFDLPEGMQWAEGSDVAANQPI